MPLAIDDGFTKGKEYQVILTESRILKIVRNSERKLQYSDEAISIWKYLYRK